ncbi:MAG: DUF3277 domain-containing protein [Firmicutes bacterium]|nr:DUF3277 domain-containing protein [Bacillota bacterium]
MADEKVRQYDPRDVAVVIDGHTVVGFADGTFIEAEKNEDDVSADVGAQGDVTFVFSADNTGTITMTLKHNSPSLTKVMELRNKREPFSIRITDRNFEGDVSVGGSQAMIQKAPPFSRGDSVEDVEVAILVADWDQVFNDSGE